MKLYVGSRNLKPDGYLSVDIDPGNHPDIVADIRDMRAVADDSCDEVSASHVLEHLEWPDSFKALAEFARALKTGGLLKVSVPDMRLLVEMLAAGEMDFHAAGLLFGVGGRTNPFEQHRYGFTERMLRRLLTILGFGAFDWWTSTLPEGANGWCPVGGGAKVAISINMAARKLATPAAKPSAIYEALTRRPLDDPATVVADLIAQQPAATREPLDVPVYQRIHFHLIDAIQRIKFLEDEIRGIQNGRR